MHAMDGRIAVFNFLSIDVLIPSLSFSSKGVGSYSVVARPHLRELHVLGHLESLVVGSVSLVECQGKGSEMKEGSTMSPLFLH